MGRHRNFCEIFHLEYEIFHLEYEINPPYIYFTSRCGCGGEGFANEIFHLNLIFAVLTRMNKSDIT